MTNVSPVFLFSMLLTGSLCLAAFAAGGLPDDVRAALQAPNGFEVRATVGAIPDSVRAAFAKLVHDEAFSMAEPGKSFQLTDVASPGERLPARRLGKVALSKSFCILFYERGGIVHTYQVAVFRLNPDGARLVWSGYSNRIITGPADLLAAVDKDQIHADAQHL